MVTRVDGGLTEDALRFLEEHPELCLTGNRVGDRFLCIDSDRGLRGVALLSAADEELAIREWACDGDCEWELMNAVVAEASACGCTRVRGEFTATGRNEGMREALAGFGFTRIGEDEHATWWILPVAAYDPVFE